jgi:hypothetical protein
MSRQRKTAAVLQLLRGEHLEQVFALARCDSRDAGWRDAFVVAGEANRTLGRRRLGP